MAHLDVVQMIRAMEAKRGCSEGIASLDSTSKVPLMQLGGLGADNTKFLRGDQTWQVPPGGGYPATSVTGGMSFGLPSSPGSVADYSRGDHAHGTPANPVPDHAALTASVHNFDASGKAPAQAHNQDASTINAGTLDGDRLPTLSATKKGGAPATGAPSGKFLKDDGTWATPAGGGESEIVVMVSQDTPNATTTLANATGFSFLALANATYIIEGLIVWKASVATVGIKLSATGPTSPTMMAGQFITNAVSGTPDSSAFNANDVVVTTTASAFTTGNIGMLHCVLITGANGGTFQVRFAAETTGTITICAGSILRYRQVA